LTLSILRQQLLEEQRESLRVRQVPNARLLADLKINDLLAAESGVETVGELRDLLRGDELNDGIEPEDVWALAASLGYDAEISWARSGARDRFDVLFKRADSRENLYSAFGATDERKAKPSLKPLSHYANNPLQGSLRVACFYNFNHSSKSVFPIT
jgi:hypothetical protein